uniref:starch-binding protein n=1 Tax=Anaerosporobacter faecicola TaxID=2718714 RepID=UPI0038BB600F
MVEATNANGTRNATYTFYKAYASESLEPDTSTEYNGILYVKSYDGSAPYVYAWKDTSTALTGAWPGTQMTEMNEDGYYVMDLGTTATYNVVLNNGSGTQSSDISNLEGSVWIELTSSNYAYDIVAREVEAETTPITFYVDSYTNAAPYLYIWDSDGNTYNGSFPGKALTEMTTDGFYTLTIDSYSSSVNCIVSYGGNTTQSDNITGITDEVWITLTSSDCSTYDVVKSSTADSYYDTLKKETRETKNMTAENYTDETFSVLYSYVEPADALIALGEENAAEADLIEMIQAIQTAQAGLVVVKPTVSGILEGSTCIYGTAAYGSDVTLTIGSTVYTTNADDLTGEYSVTVDALALTDTVLVTCSLGDNSSNTYTYNVDPNNNAEVTSVTLNESDVTVALGNTTTLTATVLPSNAADRSITWTTSDPFVASVSSGIVTGIAEGTATITAITSNGLTATVAVTVTVMTEEIAVTSITLNQSTTTLVVGDTATLIATILPSNATDQSVTWTTSDSSVASVSHGVVSGIAEGTATITATTSNGLTATVAVTVTVETSYMYFEKPSSWGTTIYAYIWNDDVTYTNASWPGVVTTCNKSGIYVIEWPTDYTGTDLNIIFTDRTHQTADLEAIKNGYYTSSGYSYTVVD